MTGQCLIWSPVIVKNVQNEDYLSDIPDLIARKYRGRLVSEILSMPNRNPISFTTAIQIIKIKMREAFDSGNAEKYMGYQINFVAVISDMGFHIELAGDEFTLPKILPFDY